ncbi:hypothetical protein SCAB_56072 [Streptomyces scabiei 87.22]|uniref:Uncharacterized protein n=1 Tax=Streptomyces scabiei (strain 87.22) TaxID=680198 RepID=C9Z124_STRSW|nr:hypothetical protein [Streptomyces scabiei]MDX2577706.1 hypothetical protein [Streptomyces scabiei]MDX2656133.1 hypothetical protein [Streptomyces scabiei]MDX2723033.1 hypothetical protein [Streptomyces scabiei]MDX2868745.1 hypothetical protein [Streptomyces scabiei]MDX2886659.1 hypothetical protein [Streptomyces scabiei]
MSVKWSVAKIAVAHFKTYWDANKDRPMASDYVTFLGVPILLAIFAGIMTHAGHFHIRDVSKLIGGMGVFTGLLFGLLTNVFTLSLRVRRDEGLDPENEVVKQVRELFFNVSWAVVVGCVLITVLVLAAATHSTTSALGSLWTGLLTFLFLHLMLTILMALKRLWYAHDKVAKLPAKEE